MKRNKDEVYFTTLVYGVTGWAVISVFMLLSYLIVGGINTFL